MAKLVWFSQNKNQEASGKRQRAKSKAKVYRQILESMQREETRAKWHVLGRKRHGHGDRQTDKTRGKL